MGRNEKVAVVIPAAGSGLRLGGTKKQYRLLGDRKLLIQTLYAFDRHPDVDSMTVAVGAQDVEEVTRQLARESFSKPQKVVAGGASRMHSVGKAIHALPERIALVLVHDAVRPFVSLELISSVIDAVRRDGAAAPAITAADTLRMGADQFFGRTIPRDGVYRMQTPQGARREWLEKAYARAATVGAPPTDDVELLQQAGYRVAIVEGSSLNFKITTRADWELARILWPEWKRMQVES